MEGYPLDAGGAALVTEAAAAAFLATGAAFLAAGAAFLATGAGVAFLAAGAAFLGAGAAAFLAGAFFCKRECEDERESEKHKRGNDCKYNIFQTAKTQIFNKLWNQ
jgi:membrane protein implicated in regulation of membrane protease activity